MFIQLLRTCMHLIPIHMSMSNHRYPQPHTSINVICYNYCMLHIWLYVISNILQLYNNIYTPIIWFTYKQYTLVPLISIFMLVIYQGQPSGYAQCTPGTCLKSSEWITWLAPRGQRFQAPTGFGYNGHGLVRNWAKWSCFSMFPVGIFGISKSWCWV